MQSRWVSIYCMQVSRQKAYAAPTRHTLPPIMRGRKGRYDADILSREFRQADPTVLL